MLSGGDYGGLCGDGCDNGQNADGRKTKDVILKRHEKTNMNWTVLMGNREYF